MPLIQQQPKLSSALQSLTLNHPVTGSDVSSKALWQVSQSQHWKEIAAKDCGDQLACTEYIHEIMQNLLSAEVRLAKLFERHQHLCNTAMNFHRACREDIVHAQVT